MSHINNKQQKSLFNHAFFNSFFLILLLFVMVKPAYTVSYSDSFQIWKYSFTSLAKSAGISQTLIDQELMQLRPDKTVLRLSNHQSEFSKTIGQYLKSAASPQRIHKGRAMLRKHRRLFRHIEQRFGVQAEYLVAIWGLESNYGSNFGNKQVIRSLATLAYGSKRNEFYEKELIAALGLLQRGEIASSQKMLGSWAGAMGHTQFMPSTLQRFGIDYDRDGYRDLWNSLEDVFASTANYLSMSGWEKDQTWSIEVTLPKVFNWQFNNPNNWMKMSDWSYLGVRPVHGGMFAANDQRKARLFLPAGQQGPIFLVFNNFEVIKKYNNADSYAMAVGYLGDRIRGKSPLVTPWPQNDKALSRIDKQSLQQLLSRLGYNTGVADGKIGPNTQKAIRQWQLDMGLAADGYADETLIAMIQLSME